MVYVIIKPTTEYKSPKSFKGYGVKTPVRGIKLVARALLPGHIPKGVWVAKAIAGDELYGFVAKNYISLIL